MGKQWQTVFLGSKITAYGDYSHEIKRHLLLGRKVITNTDSILKSRDIALPTKVCLVKALDFPVVTYGCESWTVKKVEHRRIDVFELWCWRRLLRVPWTARRSNQSILKNISSIHWKDWCWSWNSNTLATWCEELTHLKRPWSWERLKAGGSGTTEGEMVGWHHWLSGREFEWTPAVTNGQGGLECCGPWGHIEVDTTEQRSWTDWLQVFLNTPALWKPGCCSIFFFFYFNPVLLSWSPVGLVITCGAQKAFYDVVAKSQSFTGSLCLDYKLRT